MQALAPLLLPGKNSGILWLDLGLAVKRLRLLSALLGYQIPSSYHAEAFEMLPGFPTGPVGPTSPLPTPRASP